MNVLLPALAALVVGFVILAMLRFGAARRGQIMNNWPAILFTLVGVVSLARGGVWVALAMGAAAAFAYFAAPTARPAQNAPPPPQRPREDPAALARARALLDVRLHASEDEIRTAFRAKMAEAHPDRGGTDAEAARLVAARDLLLGKR